MRARQGRTFRLLAAAALLAACGGSDTPGDPDAGMGDLPLSDVPPLTDTGPADDAAPDDAAPADAAPDDTSAPDTAETSGFNYPCTPGTYEACVTACGSAGQRLCLKDWGPCVPPAEFCGNCADDDCNGVVNEGCPATGACDPPPEPTCPVAIISLSPGTQVDTGATVTLSAADSTDAVSWQWGVQAPDGSATAFLPSATAETVTFLVDVAGTFLFTLDVEGAGGLPGCAPAQVAVVAVPFPPAAPEVGCADGQREGFLDQDTYAQIAGCSGAWDQPGISPPTVQPTCNRQGGDDGAKAGGLGCSAPDLCAQGWHVCNGWQEVAAKSQTGCAAAVPPGAKSKSLFFAMRQASTTGSVCGAPGDGWNDVFGCGNLGAGLGPDKGCGPLDRVLASTQPDTCGFNEAEPPLGPWECVGGPESHLGEGQHVTKKACQGGSCSYDGDPIGSADKGGVLCCRD